MKKAILSLTLLLAIGLMASKVDAQISVGISVRVAPPPIPVYTQPPCPVDGYLWVPGYWSWDDELGYYWVPGYWTAPPEVGLLWTPGYWGWGGGVYAWHAGYWGPHVGFYGGVNYGCGYGGVGYVGGGWYSGHFRYNTAVTNVNTTVVHNTYINRTVVNNVTVNNRVSYNGGPGGVRSQPSREQAVAMNEHHIAATNMQTQHQQSAHQDRNAFVNVNHGHPSTTAVSRPMHFNNHATANTGHIGGVAHPQPQPQLHEPQRREALQPQAHQQPQFHAQPQVRQQPQFHPQAHPQPQFNHPAPRPAPHPAPPHGGGEEHHHR